jgi:hypothetical protein
MKLLAIFILFATQLCAGSPPEFTTARLYFVPWDVMTSTAMRPREVRTQASLSIVLSDAKSIAELLAFIPNQRATKDLDYAVYDVRLVIDLEGPGGNKKTFIASRLAISEEQTPETNARIDETFRVAIESWLRKRANQALEHNAAIRHARCCAPVAPAGVVAHL